MDTAAKRSLVFTNLSPLNVVCELPGDEASRGFYQEIVFALAQGLRQAKALTSYADWLIRIADGAHSQRTMSVVSEASQLLVNLPLRPHYRSVGRYYQAVCLWREGRVREARAQLERVAEEGSPKFRARALLSLGTSEFMAGHCNSALPFYFEAGRVAKHVDRFDAHVTLGLSRMIAVLKGADGDHKRSLNDLERLFPLARMVGREHPPLFPDYLNSYAVELAAAGRLEEARNVSRIVLASPYASAYPEWRETFDEIAGRGPRPSRSTVGFCGTAPNAGNVVRLSEFARPSETTAAEPRAAIQPGPVVDIQKWKENRVPKESSQTPELTPEQIAAMTPGQRRAAIAELIWGEEVSEQALQTILTFIEYTIRQEKAKG